MNAAASLDAALGAVMDFPDRIGPVLVKELRLGLHSGLFVLPFAIAPVGLALVALWALSLSDTPSARASVDVGFWLIVVVALFVVAPLRALGAMRRERAADSFDLLHLTRLTPWTIVTSKWTSLLVQAGLALVALLPFFVLRYFFGGVDLLAEMLVFVWLLALGVTDLSVCLMVSSFRRAAYHVGVVILVLLGAILGVPVLAAFLAFIAEAGISEIFAIPPVAYVLLGVVCTFVNVFALSLACSCVAPRLEQPPPTYRPTAMVVGR